MKPGLTVRRIGLLAGNTLREALRQRSSGLLWLLALVFLGGTWFFLQFNFGASELKFVADLGLGVLSLLGAVLAIAATVQTFFDALENRTLHLLLARGVGRGEFILGKLLGIQLLLGLFALVVLACLAPILWLRESMLLRMMPEFFDQGRGVNLAGLAIAGWALWLKSGVLAAAVLWLCTLAGSRLYVLITGFLLLVGFHTGTILKVYSQQTMGAGRWLAEGLRWLLPDFGAFDLSAAVFGEGGADFVSSVRLLAYAAIYLVVFSVLAIRTLRGREL